MNAGEGVHMKFTPNRALYFALFFPFIKPAYFSFIPALDQIYDVWRIASMLAIVSLYVMFARLSRYIILLFLYQFVLFFATIINSGDILKFLSAGCMIVACCMLTELAAQAEVWKFIDTICFILFFWVFANMISAVVFPNGIVQDSYYYNSYYLLAGKNNFVVYSLASMLIGTLRLAFYPKKKALTFMIFLCTSVCVILTWSATGIVGWFILLSYILIFYRRRLKNYFSFHILFAIVIASNIGVLFFNVQNRFAFLIEFFLHKNVTLTNRTEIWKTAIGLISRSPLWGYGVYEGRGLILWRGVYMYAHNAALETLLQGGIVALISLAALVFACGARLEKYRSHAIAGLFSVCLFAYLIVMVAESYTSFPLFFWVLAMAFNVDKILAQQAEFTARNAMAGNGMPASRYIKP